MTLTATPPYRTSLDGWEPSALGCEGATCAVDLPADTIVTVRAHAHPFVRLSATDKDPLLRLREDGLAADFYIHDAVRSEQSVAPGDGVRYFEAHLLTPDRGEYGFGVQTAAAPVVVASLGADDQGFGLAADGSVFYDGAWEARIAGGGDLYGIVVDYRGATPTAYVIAPASGGSAVVHTRALPAVTEPLFIYLVGSKRVPSYELALRVGNDTTALPFELDPDGALRTAGLTDVADALTLGWSDPYAGPPDAPPSVTVSADQVVTAGTTVTVSADASDSEDGDLTGSIEWELLSSPHYAGRVRGSGSDFTFTPTAVGLHPARARVRDHTGQVTEAIVQVQVPGPVAQQAVVQLAHDPLDSAGATISPDGLSAHFHDPGKYGLRANQSLYGGMGYFEIQRLAPGAVNVGGGLVTGDGDIAPYTWADIPASCSVNMEAGVWHDLVWVHDFPGPAASFDTFGFAVDYRGEHPLVYVITEGEVIDELALNDVWVEVYPMIYGNPLATDGPHGYDEAINFGASPFAYDARAALTAYGVDVTGFTPGWGQANTTP